jgi:hypothetical protein
MNKIILLCLMLPIIAIGQNRYMVQYDKLNDDLKYFELTYEKGTFTELEIDKPTVAKGDLVKFRCINTNQFVFQMDIPKYNEIEAPNDNAVTKVSNGFSAVFSDLSGTLGQASSQLMDITRYPPEKPSPTSRGTTLSAKEQLRNDQLKELELANSKMEEVLSMIISYADATKLIYREDLSLDEIRSGFNQTVTKFSVDEYEKAAGELEDYKKDLESYEELSYSETNPFYDGFDYIDEVNDENSLANPKNSAQVIQLLEDATFILEDAKLVGVDKYGDFKSIDNDTEFLEFNIVFKSHEQDYDFKDDNIIQSKLIELPMAGGVKMSFSTGLTLISPFKGFTEFSHEKHVDNDSIQFSSALGASFRTTISTNVMMEFPNKCGVTPNVSFGMAMGFFEDDNTTLNFLLGGGFKFDRFPYMSISTGLSFIEISELKPGYTEGTWQYYDGYDSEIKDEFYQKAYVPGYYLGLNFNF